MSSLKRGVNFKYIDGIVLSSGYVMRQIDHDAHGYEMKVRFTEDYFGRVTIVL